MSAWVMFESLLNQKISEHFKWGEAIWCPRWAVFCLPDSKIQQNIVQTAQKLEAIRSIFGGRPLIITSWWRPERYNTEIGGAARSAHTEGLAVDFRVLNQDPQVSRDHLIKHLESLQIRMEIQPEHLEPHEDWIHIDLRPPKNGERVFSPGVKLAKNNYTTVEE